MAHNMYDNQFGFRGGHSTLDLTILTIEEIITELDTKGHAIPLYFDLGKAFDTLDTSILLTKLEKYGTQSNQVIPDRPISVCFSKRGKLGAPTGNYRGTPRVNRRAPFIHYLYQ